MELGLYTGGGGGGGLKKEAVMGINYRRLLEGAVQAVWRSAAALLQHGEKVGLGGMEHLHHHSQDVVMATSTDNDAAADVEEMKKRLQEMEYEAAALREMQAKVEKEMGSVQDPSSSNADQANKEEIDSRSVFVGNVDYACTPEEVQQHFQSCGTVNRITIRTNKFGQPKGYAYVEFLEPEAVQEALRLNESELHGRQLKVSAKRTNIPGMKQFRPRRPNPYMGGYPFSGGAYPTPYMYNPYSYGKVPRFRMPSVRYGPY
ncbi:hypothetical protein Nepgr_004856 [Nepenthes gracilis]|uniref:RRM domain-containing protein n=1 Tax=Nepenthes gracilis TaxID=150966 RepID=A0AAD3S2E7_NEPGR|nr:hypothetical protein Nepgr_004856 [Nepenthes gracilis]